MVLLTCDSVEGFDVAWEAIIWSLNIFWGKGSASGDHQNNQPTLSVASAPINFHCAPRLIQHVISAWWICSHQYSSVEVCFKLEDALDIEVEIPKSHIPPTLAWYGLICGILWDGYEICFGGGTKRLGRGPLPLFCNVQLAMACVLHMSRAAEAVMQLKVDADDSDTAYGYVASDYFRCKLTAPEYLCVIIIQIIKLFAHSHAFFHFVSMPGIK